MRLKLTILLILCLATFGNRLNSQTDVNNAQAIFIYNFLSHIKWPDGKIGNEYTIGVYGNTSTTRFLEVYTANRTVGAKPINIVTYSTISEIEDCEVLLVSYNKTPEISELDKKLSSKSCLIIGEKEDAINSGASISFKLVGNKLRFQLDKSKAESHNLIVSAALVQLAI